MRVHVEIRYKEDRFIARFRPQRGFTGLLMTRDKGSDCHQKPCLTVLCDPLRGYPKERPTCPELYDVQLIHVFGDELWLRGQQLYPDGKWRKQEWDVILLEDPSRSIFPRGYP